MERWPTDGSLSLTAERLGLASVRGAGALPVSRPAVLRAARTPTHAPDSTPPRPLSPSPSFPRSLSPWVAIWLRPRAAFRAALEQPAAWRSWAAAALAGVAATLGWSAGRGLGTELGAGELLALALVAGAPLGAAALVLAGVLLRTGGRLLGGQAGAGQVRTVLSLAQAPVLVSLPLWLAQLALLPAASFGVAPDLEQALLAGAWGALHGVLWAWAAALSVVGLSEAHGLPLWRAAASWLLGALAGAAGVIAILGGAAMVIGLIGG